MKKMLLGMVFLTALGLVAACGGGGGGGSGAPVIVSVTDGAGNAVAASGTTGVFPTQFTVTFDQAMDDASVTTAGNISGTCGGHEATFTVTATETAGEYLVVPDGDAWKVALLECAVTFSANIKSSGGTPMVAATYTFTNACAVNDDFNAQSISDDTATSCWSVYPNAPATYPTWASMNGIISFDTANSTLDADFTGEVDKVAIFRKTASANGDDIVGEIRVSYTDLRDGNEGMVFVALFSDFIELETYVIAGMRYDSGLASTICYGEVKVNETGATYRAPCAEDTEYYVRFMRSGTTLGIPEFRRGSDATYTQMTKYDGDITLPATVDFGSDDISYTLVFQSNEVTGGDLIDVHSVTMSGVEVTGQY